MTINMNDFQFLCNSMIDFLRFRSPKIREKITIVGDNAGIVIIS